MPTFTYNMLSRKRVTNQEARHRSKIKQKKCVFTRDALASSANKPYKRSQKISMKDHGFVPITMGAHFSLRPHTGAKGSSNRMHKKSCNNRASSANQQYKERSHVEHLECINRVSLASKQDEERSRIEAKSRVISGNRLRLSIPFQIGCYAPGTEPDHIPYHLYMLVKEAVDIMKRFKWHKNTNDLIDLTRVEKKVKFFCIYFHSHLPKNWEYDRDNASSLIAGYDAIFAKEGGRPRYLMSGYTPLGDQVKEEFDLNTRLSTRSIVDIMRIVHSRKTPTPETFMEWGWPRIIFYCKLCSCFGIDYQHLETASEDDVCLMNMGSSSSSA